MTFLCSLHFLSGVEKTKLKLRSSILIFAVSSLHFANTLWFRLVATSHHAANCSLPSWWDKGEKKKQNRIHGLGYKLCTKRKKRENGNKIVKHGMEQPCAYFRLAVLALPWSLSHTNMAEAVPLERDQAQPHGSCTPITLPQQKHQCLSWNHNTPLPINIFFCVWIYSV